MDRVAVGVMVRVRVIVMIMVRKMYLSEQDGAAMSEDEGSLDRTTQVTGQHYMDGFYDQDGAAMSEGNGAEQTDREQ